QRIQRLGLTDTVRLMPYGDPMPVYRAIDALLLPSAQEGFSYVCAEAMSVGRAVLRTCTAGCHEQIIEGITGRMVEVNKDAFIHTALEMLTGLPALRAMGQVAAAHVRERLTITRQVEQTEQLYRTLGNLLP